MRDKPGATLVRAVASLRRCWILRAFFLTAISLPAIAWLRHALQGRFHALAAVDWMSLEVIYAVVLGPIAEEIIFRAWMIPFLSRHMDVRLAALISGLGFYFGHSNDLGFTGVIGTVLFTALWLRSKSLWVCILAHAGWNLGVVIRDGGMPSTFLPI